MLPRQVHRLFRKILRDAKTYEYGSSLYIKNALIIFSTSFLQPQVFAHIVEKEHDNDCKLYSCKSNYSCLLLLVSVHFILHNIFIIIKYDYCVSVYFQSVPDLIRERKIDLNNGYAVVSCSMWKNVLESLFNTMIEHEYKYLNIDMKNIIEMDPRLNLIHKKLRAQLLEEENFRGTITATNIDIESKKFPLCMQHLHRVLRDRHRLSHFARFYYSLFLKECGMELESAIHYWRNEYSKPHTCSSGCTHDWQTSEKKFVYSIRHFYGLEGGRKNYRAPKCEMIQVHNKFYKQLL